MATRLAVVRSDENPDIQPHDRWNTVVEMFFDQAARYGERPFLSAKQDEAWTPITWAAAARMVAKLAGALRAIGLKPGDRVMLVSENRPEWCLTDLAIMAAGGITTPAYITNTVGDHQHILSNSGACFAVVSSPKLAQTLLPAAYQSATCRTVIGIEPLKRAQASVVDILDWQTLIDDSTTTVEDVLSWQTAGRDDTACLIYTSGTGGASRGVMHHHGALLHNVRGGIDVIRNEFPQVPDTFLSFLPLSHAYEHTMGQFFAIGLGAQTCYAESLDKLMTNIGDVKPTVVIVVPRLFEVMRQKIERQVEKAPWLRRQLFALTLYLGRERRARQLGWIEGYLDRLMEKLVRAKMRDRFGGRLKALVSGGAPLNPEVGQFFDSLGLTLMQGYGMTEAAPLVAVNRPSRGLRMNSVGPAVKDTQVKIAEDGEILVRGALVTHGYWNNPEETARVIRDGWLHTGDIGRIDPDGHIVITDRKKDLIVNDKGDNVSPQRVEGMLTLEPEILQAMVYGDRRPYLVGLVVPNPDWTQEWTAARGLANDARTLVQNPEFHKALQAAVDRVNGRLSVIERVRRIAIADSAFSVENSQMTPTLKVRRHILRQTYGDRLEKLYGG